MEIDIVVPQVRRTTLEELSAMLSEQSAVPPFSAEIIDFCSRFSQAIFRDNEAARYPELAALAFWMRKAELIRLRDEFEKLGSANTVAAPRGLIFHIPPGNVDTIFVYSWLLAALTGNRNVIRMSSRRSPQSDCLIRLWRESIGGADTGLANNTFVIAYERSDEVTGKLSSMCDVRVIWGGDHTVNAIRTSPLAPHAREVTFPDRSSLAVIRTDGFLALDEAGRTRLAEQFFNDAYWFDQMACSSPRAVVWCGDPEGRASAEEEFWNSLTACIRRRGYESAPAVHMRKLVFACESILDLPVSKCRKDPETTILSLDSFQWPKGGHCGGGLFFSARVDRLSDLAPALSRKDQTLTHFGFGASELREFARLPGRAIDRIVPIGNALQFSRFWDGYDLLHEYCRFIYCEAKA
jgi:hypothetical protein